MLDRRMFSETLKSFPTTIIAHFLTGSIAVFATRRRLDTWYYTFLAGLYILLHGNICAPRLASDHINKQTSGSDIVLLDEARYGHWWVESSLIIMYWRDDISSCTNLRCCTRGSRCLYTGGKAQSVCGVLRMQWSCANRRIWNKKRHGRRNMAPRMLCGIWGRRWRLLKKGTIQWFTETSRR